VPGAAAAIVAATFGIAGLTALPAAAAPGRAAGTPHGQWLRANTGNTHSPRLLRQLAGPAGTRGPVISGPKAAATNGPVSGALQGIDVSSHQESQTGGINWSTVAGDGIKFAAIKATEGAYYTNSYAPGDLAGAKSAGLTTLAYAFAIPNGGSNGSTHYSASPVVQADDLISFLGSAASAVPLMLDIEYDPYAGPLPSGDGTTGVCYGLSQSQMVSWISSFDAEIRAKTGRVPVIYTPPQWWATCTGGSTAFGNVPLWVPDYSSSGSPVLPAGWGDWGMWQYSSSGTVTGIQGNADLDQFNPDGYLAPGALMLFSPGDQEDLAASGAAVSLPVTALAQEPGPALTYSGQGLPSGLTLDSGTGVISGTAPAAGAYPVTITASDATSGASGSVSFTWYAHGTVSVTSPGNQSTVAGSPVDSQVTASDSVSGQTLSFSASGLPPGLSVGSSGLITGWPSKPGTYQVTVTAADPLRASGAASFTWTVSAAPTAGPAGPVKLDLGGKCLNDMGNSSANGTAQDIWTCNGSASQHWTVVKDDTLRIHGKCLDVYHGGTVSGTKVDLYACNGSGAQQWQVQTAGELVNPASGKCLTDPAGSTTNGTRLQIVTCAGKNYQKWTLPAGPVVSQLPGRCLNDDGNLTANGTKINIWACNGSAAQAWTVSPDGTVRIHGKCLDVYHGGTSSGTALDLYSCNGTGAQQWRIAAAGPGVTLVNPASGLGVYVSGTSTANGTPAVLGTVTGTPRGAWRIQ
jgi:GH25 family lysozyme M1 (1,4-beta-N-acetylmuramidase)